MQPNRVDSIEHNFKCANLVDSLLKISISMLLHYLIIILGFQQYELEMQLTTRSPLRRSNRTSSSIQGLLVSDTLYLFFFIDGCIKILSECFVSKFSLVADDVLRSSPMVVLSSSDPRHFDSQILRLSTLAVAALESTILPM